MSYLLDKKIQQKKIYKIALGVVFLLILFYFRVGVWKGFSYASEIIFHPVLVLGGGVGEKFGGLGSYFVTKNSLYWQNQNLQAQLSAEEGEMINYNAILADNTSLKEILGRKDPKIPMTVAAILSKPNQSLYDTLLIDAGTDQNVKVGNTVFALGDVPIGRISDVYPDSSKVILFSNAGETTQAIISLGHSPTGEASKPLASANAPVVSSTINDGSVTPSVTPATPVAPVTPQANVSVPTSGSNVFVQVVGRGGGNFEMVMPKDFVLQEGEQVVLPGITPHVLAFVQKIISDPRNPFVKVLLTSPVNIQDLKFVEVGQ